MSDHARRPDAAPRPSAPAPPSPDALLDAIAAGRHDDALVRLAAAAVAAEPASAAWDDPQFVSWWIGRARSRADRAAERLGDAAFLAAGRALHARATARQAGIQWHDAPPPERAAAVRAAPIQAIGLAAAAGATPVVELAAAAGDGREIWDAPVAHWVELPAEIPRGRYLALRIAGDSMEPVMHTGDTVLLALGRPLRVGAVVVARVPDDGYVCKRVRALRAGVAELESLAPGRPTIVIPRDDRLVVGQVVATWCSHCSV